MSKEYNSWGSSTHNRKPLYRAPRHLSPQVAHDAWDYNTVPWADREWMKSQQSDQDKAVLSLNITGGAEVPDEE